MIDKKEQHIIDYIRNSGESSSKEVFDGVDIDVSYATLKRILSKLISENYLVSKGQGKGTKYLVSPAYEIIQPVDIEQYMRRKLMKDK